MPFENSLTRRLGVRHPVIQAPMGGATTVELVVAACEAGALGSVAAAYFSPEQITEFSREVRDGTDRPFGINLFAPVATPESAGDVRPALEFLAPYHERLGLPAPEAPSSGGSSFAEQCEAALESGASVFSFTFGVPPGWALEAARARGMFLIGTATTVAEAIELEAAGVDAVVAQGSEAGAHRGTFAGEFDQALVGTAALVPQVVDAIGLPVIASGGLMDGRGLVAALALGASAVQMGTAFLVTDEAGVPDVHKEAIVAAQGDATRVTRAFSGRPARGIVNEFMAHAEARDAQAAGAILPYPFQNSLTRPMRNEAARRGQSDYLSLWSGQGTRLARRTSAAELVSRITSEAEGVLFALTSEE